MRNASLDLRCSGDSSCLEVTNETASGDVVGFATRSVVVAGVRTVHMFGELDIVGRTVAMGCCLEGHETAVIVDMSLLTFLDSGGFDGVESARHSLEHRGGSLGVVNSTGEPARFLALLDALDHADV